MPRPPPNFHGLYGQRRVVDYVRRRIEGAKERTRPCPHFLLTGPNGIGKSCLAERISIEYGEVRFVPVLGSNELRPADLAAVLRDVEFADVVFIDELHSLRRDAQQFLYTALDKWMITVGTESESIAEFSLLGATDQPGSVFRGLRTRMDSVALERYSVRELKAMAEVLSTEMQYRLTPQAARRIAEAALGTPRGVKKLLQALADFEPSPAEERWTQPMVEELLSAQGIDDHGLGTEHRRYLRRLIREASGTSSLAVVSLTIGDPVYVQQEIEPLLVERGLVTLGTGRGRKLTDEGLRIADEIRRREESEDLETGGEE